MSWKKLWRRSRQSDSSDSFEQPASEEKSWEQIEIEKAQWAEMKIDSDEVESFNRVRKSRNKNSIDLAPQDLASITRNLNQALRDNGYPIEFTYKRTLGLLSGQLAILVSMGKDVPLPRLAINQYAEHKVRQKFNLSPRVDLSRDQLEEVKKFLKAMAAEAKANLESARVSLISQTSSTGTVADRQDLRKLILYQAEVMARRKHPEIKKNDPIPGDILEQEIKQAKSDYRKMHNLPEDWQSAYW